jgi:hypothetical protein
MSRGRRGVAAGLLLALAGLSACDDFKPAPASNGRPSVAAEATFKHEISGDLSGSYIPAAPISIDGWRVKSLYLGQDADFTAYESGSKTDGFAPVMIEFEKDGAGPIRVLPKSYSVTDGRIRFEGADARLGNVAFNGTLDQGALATARRNLGEEAPVLTGTLRAGGTAFGGQKFRWYGGD